jgi:hypothetical protein
LFRVFGCGTRTSNTPATGRSPGRIWRRLAAVLALGVLSVQGATIEDNNTWFHLTITGPLGGSRQGLNRWRYSFDNPNRFANNSSEYAQGVWRAGVSYLLNSKWSVWAGYSYSRTDTPYTSAPVYEHRAAQQIMWADRAGEFSLSSRQRLEERFPDVGQDTGFRYRHQLRVSHPLGLAPPLSWVLWDEIFFNLNDTDYGATSGLEQNRAFAGFGWKWSEVTRSEVGYLNQYGWRPGKDDRVNHVLAIYLTLTFK